MATSLGSTFEDDLADLGDSSGVTKCLGCGKDTEKGNRRELGTKSSSFIIPSLKFVLATRLESSNLDTLISKSFVCKKCFTAYKSFVSCMAIPYASTYMCACRLKGAINCMRPALSHVVS